MKPNRSATEQNWRPGLSDEIGVADYHTAGEPFRIAVRGVPDIEGSTMLDRRSWAQDHLDDLRALLINEPRGHADMYGCFPTPPDDPGAALGVLFFHKDGFSTACGHGTIALATWVLHSGLVDVEEPTTRFAIDVPSGRVAIDASVTNGRVGEVRFINVPAWVSATGVELRTSRGKVTVDVSYGGAFYASLDAGSVGLSVTPEDLGDLIAIGREIKWLMNEHLSVQHPSDDRLSGCYGTIIHESMAAEGHEFAVRQRNVTLFADGEVDRSPCGSGTSARLALLHHHRQIATGETLRHESIIGTVFTGSVIDSVIADGRPAVVTRIGGRASATGTATFRLDPDDEVGLGFQLR